jgi:hypothetical protein
MIVPCSVAPAVSFCLSFGLGSYILLCDPKKGLNRTFFALGLAAAIYNFSQVLTHYAVDAAGLMFWTRMSFIGAVLLPVIAVRFCREFFGVGSIHPWIQWALFPYTLVMLWVNFTEAMFREVDFSAGDRLVRAGWAMTVSSLVISATVGYLIWRFLVNIRAATDHDHRNRMMYLAFGAGMYLIAGGIDVARRFDLLVIFTVPVADYATMLFMLLLAHVIRRHRLIEIREFIGRTIAASATMLLMAVVFIVIEETLEGFISSMVASKGEESLWPGVIAAMVVGALFFPLRKQVEKFTARFTGIGDTWWRRDLELPPSGSLSEADRQLLTNLADRIRKAIENPPSGKSS